MEIGEVLGTVPEYKNEAMDCYTKVHLYQMVLDEKSPTTNVVLYSFRSITDYTLSDLINNTLTVVSPLRMNDPFDTLLYSYTNASSLRCERRLSMIKENNKLFGESLYQSQQLFCESLKYYRIRCFSRVYNDKIPYENTLMWSHYASAHTGICIAYNMDSRFLFKRYTNALHASRSITYTEEPINMMDAEEFDGQKSLFCKSKDWEYEHEFRLVTYIPEKEGEYLPLPLDDSCNIQAIYFGVNCSEQNKLTIKNIFKANKEIRFYDMTKDYTDLYRLKAIETK